MNAATASGRSGSLSISQIIYGKHVFVSSSDTVTTDERTGSGTETHDRRRKVRARRCRSSRARNSVRRRLIPAGNAGGLARPSVTPKAAAP